MAIESAPPIPAPPTLPLPKPVLPGVREVVDQVIRDLFGKDVQDTVTFSYEWTADQFGHFALGFEITLVLSWFATLLGYRGGRVGLWLGLAVVAGFALKEAGDFFRQWKKAQDSKSIFKFNGGEIFFNTFTAVFYIGIGALVAGLGLLNPRYGLVALLVSIPFIMGLAYVWLRRKLTFQQAGMPYLYRLANFPNPIDKPIAEFIVGLSMPALPGAPLSIDEHLIIAGPLDSGKSSLAVGIGTEFAVRRRMGIGRYTTLAKLLQAVLKHGQWDKPEFDDGRILWPWQTSDLLIIDDVDVLADHSTGTATDVTMERRIAQTRMGTFKEMVPVVLQEALKHRRTVWVVGDIEDGELKIWREMIAGVIGVESERVKTLTFAHKLKDLDPNRASPTAAEQVKQW